MKARIKTRIYLRHSRHAALAAWLTNKYGMEVPYDYSMPEEMFLPDTTPKRGVSDGYYMQYGSNWPDRWMLYER